MIFKYDLSLDEIKNTNHEDNLNYYYDSIKGLFQDGDIIVGYSLGCIYASLIAEKLEKDKRIDKIVLIDGTLDFVNEDEDERENMVNWVADMIQKKSLMNPSKNIRKMIKKIIEISYINSCWNFHTPKINSHIIYLSTLNLFKEELECISDNYEYILIDSSHQDIIEKDFDKISHYFN
ncbi:hypothetical protein [uncultured Methanobrevibacter sp.]|uniref:hypothetical protein n=1 Tax=uncultured Methanobrevibacter sp. TaxID=253161 RepID=UPI0025E5BE13|nr:hypothetical protein [uncultured Methanobrevibacter sp.]